mgnify:CR=1 FL=1
MALRKILLGNVAIALFLRNPTLFLSNVRKRCPSLPVFGYLSDICERLSDSPAQKLREIGMLDEAVRKTSRRQFWLSWQLNQELAQLEEPILKSRPISETRPRKVVCFLTNSKPYSNSGYAIRSHEILKALDTANVQIQGVTRFGYPYVVGKSPQTTAENWDNIPYFRIVPKYFPISWKKEFEKAVEHLTTFVRDSEAELIHCTTGFQNAQVVSAAAEQAGIPWIYEVRGEPQNTWLSKFDKEKKELAVRSSKYRQEDRLELEAMKKAASVVVLSEVSKQRIIKKGIDACKIKVVPNSIDEKVLGAEVKPEWIRKSLGFKQKITFGTVSALVPYEGLETLVYALPHLPLDYELLIVGSGEDLERLTLLAEELKVRRRVHFVGYRPYEEILDWYAALDIFVLPRRDEAVTRFVTPLKAVNAQALGKPVVASDLPAIREVTGNLSHYVTAGDPVAFAEEIEKVKLGPDSASIEWAKTRTWRKSIREMLAAYGGSRTS